MTGITPGPWACRQRRGGRHIELKRVHWEVGQPNGRGVAIVFGDDASNSNAIAAAHDMLVAGTELDRFFLVIESAVRNADPSQHGRVLDALRANRDAIAKANGKQE